MAIGLKCDFVELADHNPEWEILAAQTIEQLWRVFGSAASFLICSRITSRATRFRRYATRFLALSRVSRRTAGGTWKIYCAGSII